MTRTTTQTQTRTGRTRTAYSLTRPKRNILALEDADPDESISARRTRSMTNTINMAARSYETRHLASQPLLPLEQQQKKEKQKKRSTEQLTPAPPGPQETHSEESQLRAAHAAEDEAQGPPLDMADPVHQQAKRRRRDKRARLIKAAIEEAFNNGQAVEAARQAQLTNEIVNDAAKQFGETLLDEEASPVTTTRARAQDENPVQPAADLNMADRHSAAAGRRSDEDVAGGSTGADEEVDEPSGGRAPSPGLGQPPQPPGPQPRTHYPLINISNESSPVLNYDKHGRPYLNFPYPNNLESPFMALNDTLMILDVDVPQLIRVPRERRVGINSQIGTPLVLLSL
eukprot:GHVU01127252.1.p1 GENE.GHVU01127252.1~~GHVU01127252.1.p1  ORF type:complete len:342 (+),score=30.82 GHVU01127252.1:581-1606(+)